MAWDALVTVDPLIQGVDGSLVNLNPAETAHVQIKRTGVVTDLMLVEIYSTLDNVPANRDDVPFFTFGLDSGEDSLSFIIRGIWGWVPRIINGEAVPTGTVTADLRYRKDGVDVG